MSMQPLNGLPYDNNYYECYRYSTPTTITPADLRCASSRSAIADILGDPHGAQPPSVPHRQIERGFNHYYMSILLLVFTCAAPPPAPSRRKSSAPRTAPRHRES